MRAWHEIPGSAGFEPQRHLPPVEAEVADLALVAVLHEVWRVRAVVDDSEEVHERSQLCHRLRHARDRVVDLGDWHVAAAGGFIGLGLGLGLGLGRRRDS